MADDVQIQVGAEAQQALATMAQVREVLQGLSSPLRAVRDNLGEVAEAFVAAFAVEKIREFEEHMTDIAVRTERTAAILGIAASSVDALDVAAKASGGSLEGITHAMERLGLNLARADAGSQQARAGLEALGLTAKDFVGLPTDEKLLLLADRFSVLKDGTEKAAIAMAVLGRAGAELIPTFNQGRHELEEFAAISRRAGSEATPAFLAAAHELHMEMIELQKSFQGVGQTIFTTFAPALTSIEQTLINIVQGFNNSAREAGAFAVVLGTLSAVASTIATAFAVGIATVQTLWEVTKGVVFAIGEAFYTLGRIIKAAFTLNFEEAKAAFADLGTQLQARAKITAGNMEEIVGAMLRSLKTAWQTSADDHVKIEQTKIARLAIVNAAAVAAQLKAIDAEIKVLQEGLKAKAALYDGEAKLHAITQDQKFAAVMRETQREYEAELEALGRRRQIAGQTVAQVADTDAKIKELQARHTTEMIKLDQQSMQAQMANWNTFFSGLQGAFNGQLRGLLSGQVTFAQAFKAIMGDMIIFGIQQIEKFGLEWAAGELARLTATQSGTAARIASEQAGITGTLPMRVGKFISDITADSAAVFSGIFANMAPLLGPYASIPAAAGQATVLAELANVPKYEMGTPYVPRTGLAVVHQGERITSASQNGQNVAAPIGDVHFHLAAMIADGPALIRYVRQNADVFHRILADRSRLVTT